MKLYCSTNKKIRGWKRRVRHLNKWGELIKRPNTKYFLTERGRYTYKRYTVSPFYNLVKRHPPLWFYKLIIAKLVTAYSEWQKTFDNLDVAYDLQLWIYDPAYIRSEIICYKMHLHSEKMRFTWESDLGKPIPYEKLGSKEYNLHDFEWILADDEDVWFEDDMEDAGLNGDELLAEGYFRKEQGDGMVYYAKRLGDIWIGRSKKSHSSHSLETPSAIQS